MGKSQDGPAPISEESIGYLEEVKKGKVRRFAMICKGTSVVSLVVYKKGNVEQRKKEAKESGKGQFYFGVVDGKGMDLRFVLARADGFESPPVKSASLKGFLDESAELKCKPYFEIVDAAPFVLDEADPLAARFLKLQEAALQACEAHPNRSAEINTLCRQIGSQLDQDQADQATVNLDALETLLGGLGGATSTSAPPTVDDGLATKLIEALKNLKPLLEKAAAQHPSRKAELITSFTQVRDEIKNKQLTQAQSNLVGLGKLLQSLIASPVASNPEESSPEDKSRVSDEMAQWKEKLATWGPAIKNAIAAKGPNAAEMMKLLAQASALSKLGGNISEAIVKLAQCHALAAQGATGGDLGALFNERLKAMLPGIKAASGTPAGDAAKLKASEAGVFARKQDFTQANLLLDQAQAVLQASVAVNGANDSGRVADAETSIDSPSGTTTKAEDQSATEFSIVKLGIARVEWESVRAHAIEEFKRLKNILQAEYAGDDVEQEAVTAALERLDSMVTSIDEELGERLDKVLNAAPAERPNLTTAAKAVLERFVNFSTSDKIMSLIDGNEYAPDMQVAAPLRAKLQEITTALG